MELRSVVRRPSVVMLAWPWVAVIAVRQLSPGLAHYISLAACLLIFPRSVCNIRNHKEVPEKEKACARKRKKRKPKEQLSHSKHKRQICYERARPLTTDFVCELFVKGCAITCVVARWGCVVLVVQKPRAVKMRLSCQSPSR